MNIEMNLQLDSANREQTTAVIEFLTKIRDLEPNHAIGFDNKPSTPVGGIKPNVPVREFEATAKAPIEVVSEKVESAAQGNTEVVNVEQRLLTYAEASALSFSELKETFPTVKAKGIKTFLQKLVLQKLIVAPTGEDLAEEQNEVNAPAPSPAPAKEPVRYEAEPEEEEDPEEEQSTKIDKAYVRQLLKPKMNINTRPKVKQKLTELGAKSLTELSEDKLPEFAKFVKSL